MKPNPFLKTTRVLGQGSALVLAALLFGATAAFAQSIGTGGGGMLGAPGLGMIGGSGAGMIGGPEADAGTRPTGVIHLRPQHAAPVWQAPIGAGYGTPGYMASLGAASNSGVGAGVQSDIRTGIGVTPPAP